MAVDGVTGRLNSFFFGRMYLETLINPDCKKAIEWCQKAGLLVKSGVKCPECGMEMELKKRVDRSDKYEWVCRKDNHKRARSVRKGTMFENSNLHICKVLMIIWHWVNELSIQQVMNEMDVANTTATDWYRFCRDVCIDACLKTSGKIGGEEKTVEIEESELGERKFKGGNQVEGKWVLCGVERGSDKFFMVAINERSKAVLREVILERVLPGTTIICNCWVSYAGTDEELEDYELRDDRSQESEAGKRSAAKRSRPSLMEFDGHLAENFWRRTHNIEIQRMFLAFINEIAQIYKSEEQLDEPVQKKNQKNMYYDGAGYPSH